MDIYFKDQKKNFEGQLNSLKKRSICTYKTRELIEKVTTINILTSKKLTELPLNFFFEYHIFPDYIMTSLCQWSIEKRSMTIGDTVLQQIFIPPFKPFSLKIIIGVRITNVINEPKRLGFSYETLEGHIEKGSSDFIIEELNDGIAFSIHTFSKPQNVWMNLLRHVISIPYQHFCTCKALYNVKTQLEHNAIL
jgi:hypothetical protein